MALSGSAWRDILEVISSHCASKGSGTSSLSVPSHATDSGDTSNRSAISRELDEHVAEPFGRRRRIPEHAQIPVCGAERFADAPEREQAGVGVNTFGEPVQQDGQELALECGASADAGGQRLDVPHGAARVEVAQRCEAALRGFRASAWPLRC